MSNKPTPIDQEVNWDKSKMLMSKTDLSGTIEYCNANFIKVAGYTEDELIGKPHNIIRHPDMPSVIFKVLWEHLKKYENINAVVKNMSKTGEYYWVVTDFDFVKNTDLKITHYSGIRRSISDDVVKNTFDPLYKKLKEIETASGVDASEAHLKEVLAGKSYNDWVKEILGK
nr:PAS domain-containing protein [uncultured Flavobacterium sp.]